MIEVLYAFVIAFAVVEALCIATAYIADLFSLAPIEPVSPHFFTWNKDDSGTVAAKANGWLLLENKKVPLYWRDSWYYRLSLWYHSANEVSVSCNLKEKS